MVTNPIDIETRSFEIINNEIDLSLFNEKERAAVVRVIHTTADFDYAKILRFHPLAFSRAEEALKKGALIYADTNMIISGVNKKKLCGSKIFSYVSDPDITKHALSKKITRSWLAIEKAVKEDKPEIFVIGNAPTALFALMDLITACVIRPSLVIGVPVGFVGAEEAKSKLLKMDIPSIITEGRKGGSTVGVAILNSILKRI